MIKPRFEPVVGALLLGIETRGVVTDEFYSRLERELLVAEDRYGVQLRTG